VLPARSFSDLSLVGVSTVAGSVSITLMVPSVGGVAKAELLSLSAKLVVAVVFGAPAVGMKVSASSSLVMAAAVPASCRRRCRCWSGRCH
jgi:hypothetical protein